MLSRGSSDTVSCCIIIQQLTVCHNMAKDAALTDNSCPVVIRQVNFLFSDFWFLLLHFCLYVFLQLVPVRWLDRYWRQRTVVYGVTSLPFDSVPGWRKVEVWWKFPWAGISCVCRSFVCSFFAGRGPTYSGPQHWDLYIGSMHQPRERRGIGRCLRCVHTLCRVEEGTVGVSSLLGISKHALTLACSNLLDPWALGCPECVSSTDPSASPFRPHFRRSGRITLAPCPGTHWI